MNAALAINGAAQIAPASDLQPALFENFIQFIDRGPKTTRSYVTNLRQFAAWLRYNAISRPARQDVIAYRDYLGQEHEAIQLDSCSPNGWSYRTDAKGNRYMITCKANTVAQYLRSVCQFFRWTAANGFYPNIAENVHAPKIRHDEHKKDALAPADVLAIEKNIEARAGEKIEAAAEAAKDTAGRISRATEQGKRLYAMYLLAVCAGLRTIELSRANVSDLETKNGRTILYVWGKGHSEADQRKPLAPEVAAAIREYLDVRADRVTGSSPLFVSTGNRSKGKRIAATTISTMLKQAMQSAGYDSSKLTAHSLRHTAGTNAQEITGNIYLTQKYMRHSSPVTTEIYVHCSTEKQEADIAQQLYNHYHGNGSGAQDQLQSILQTLNAQQLQQLTALAATMAR